MLRIFSSQNILYRLGKYHNLLSDKIIINKNYIGLFMKKKYVDNKTVITDLNLTNLKSRNYVFSTL